MRSVVVLPRSGRRWQKTVFILLQLCLAILIFIWWPDSRLPLPGYAVTVIAFVAAAMSLQGETSGLQKAIWMLLIAGLLRIEFKAIRSDRTSSEQKANDDRKVQDEDFGKVLKAQEADFTATANGLTDAYTQSQKNFEATMGQTKSIYSKTEKAAEIAEEGVNSLTGGDSYLTVLPIPAFPANATNAGAYRLMVFVTGNYTIWDVRVEMAETSDALKFYQDGNTPQSITLGAVSSTYASPLGPIIHPSQDKVTTYYFWVWSRSRPTVETLQIRFNHDGQRWEEAWTEWRSLPSPNGDKREILKAVDWQEMAPPVQIR